MKVKIRDKYLPKNNFTRYKEYDLLGIEDDNVRIVDDDLDPILLPCLEIEMIVDSMQNLVFEAILSFEQPYFWCILHEGDAENSLQYADIYMAYLTQKLNIDVAQRLYQQYQNTLQGDMCLWYWQKQWLKYVFKVNITQELREFNEKRWIDMINHHLNSIKI